MPDQVDWQNIHSIWYAQPALHRMRPGGSDYPRYEWVRDQIPGGARVLDVGCGAGQFAHNISLDKGCQVCGVDMVGSFTRKCNTSLARGLREAGAKPGWFVCDDFSAMTTTQMRSLGVFDVVTALEVLEHPIDVRGFRRNVKLALPAGGKLIVTTPHPASQAIGYRYKRTHAHHVRMWTRWRLEQVFGPMLLYAEISQNRESGHCAHIGAVFTVEAEG